MPEFLKTMLRDVRYLAEATNGPATSMVEDADASTPAVSLRKSLASKVLIISMIDGGPYRTLRRNLASNGLTPDEYRARYGLEHDYPMVAESYSEARHDMAKRSGVGRKPRVADAKAGAVPRRGRKNADA